MACSFWLVDALVRSGQSGEARKLWRELTGYVIDHAAVEPAGGS
jgi:pentatricopeptide repeat protein